MVDATDIKNSVKAGLIEKKNQAEEAAVQVTRAKETLQVKAAATEFQAKVKADSLKTQSETEKKIVKIKKIELGIKAAEVKEEAQRKYAEAQFKAAVLKGTAHVDPKDLVGDEL